MLILLGFHEANGFVEHQLASLSFWQLLQFAQHLLNLSQLKQTLTVSVQLAEALGLEIAEEDFVKDGSAIFFVYRTCLYLFGF